MLAEVLIFVPSIANYRVNWLTDRLRSAQLASLAAEASPEGVVPQGLRDELLRTAQVRAVALKRDEQRQLILTAEPMPSVDATYDLSFTGPNAPGVSPSHGWLRSGMRWRCSFRTVTVRCVSSASRARAPAC